MRSHRLHFIALSLFLLSLLTSSVTAQSHWWYPERGSAITVEIERPHYNIPGWWINNRGILNSVGFVGGRYQASNNVAVFWEFPFANQDVEDEPRPIDILNSYEYWKFFYESSQFMIGNPLFGMELSIADPSFFVRASFRLPIASENKFDAVQLATETDYDRFEAFIPRLYTIKLDVGYRESNDDTPVEAQVMLGTASMFSREEEAELFADYSGYLGISAGKFAGGVFFGGRFLVSVNDIEFAQRFVNIGGATLRFRLGVIEPGLLVRVNLDNELSKSVDYSYGLNMAFPLGSRSNKEIDSEWK